MIEPLPNNIALEQIEQTSAGGIMIATTKKSNAIYGIVVAVGPSYTNDVGIEMRPYCAVGDLVAISCSDKSGTHRGIDVYDPQSGKSYIVIAQGEIACKINR